MEVSPPADGKLGTALLSRLLTSAIDVVLRLSDLLPVHNPPHAGVLAHIAVALAQDHDLVTRDLILLDRLADDLLAHAVAVQFAVSQVFRPRS